MAGVFKKLFTKSGGGVLEKHGQSKKFIDQCSLVEGAQKNPNDLRLYQLNLKEVYSDASSKVRKLEFGSGSLTGQSESKAMLVVGKTGSGKTTLLNSITNLVLGVKFNDKHRFRLVQEDIDADHSLSQTDLITIYVLHHQPGFDFPHSLIIVDTPGFADTGGEEKDKELVQRFEKLFRAGGNKGIDIVHAIALVAEASAQRLTSSQEYVFKSVMELFHKDVLTNIIIFATYAGGSKANGLKKALDRVKIPTGKMFSIDNSAFTHSRGPDEDESCLKRFWELSFQEYDKFFLAFESFEGKSLTLSSDVIKQRKNLNTAITLCKSEIKVLCLTKINTTKERDMLRDGSGTTEQVVFEKERCDSKVYNCIVCRKQCTKPRSLGENVENIARETVEAATFTSWSTFLFKVGGAVLEAAGSWLQGDECGVCGHPADRHEVNDYIYKPKKTKVVAKQIVKRYLKEDTTGEMSIEDVIKVMDEHIVEQEAAVEKCMLEAKKCLITLNEIAAEQYRGSISDFIEEIIESEKKEQNPGFEERVDAINEYKTKFLFC